MTLIASMRYFTLMLVPGGTIGSMNDWECTWLVRRAAFNDLYYPMWIWERA